MLRRDSNGCAAYFNTTSLPDLGNFDGQAASGNRIGNTYDELWHSVMSAPVPPNLPAEGHEVYREELAKLIKPPIRHAIRCRGAHADVQGAQRDARSMGREDHDRLDRVRTLLLVGPRFSGAGFLGKRAEDRVAVEISGLAAADRDWGS